MSENAKYYVWVKGNREPRKEHNNVNDATNEARRLIEAEEAVEKVFVLRAIVSYEKNLNPIIIRQYSHKSNKDFSQINNEINNQKKDVCVWYVTDDGNGIYIAGTSCGRVFNRTAMGFNFCPNCGKEIERR